MLAIRQHDFGGPDVLRVDEIDDPVPAADHVRIRVAAAGVHLVDAALRRGQRLGPFGLPELPMVPGREVAGVVDAVGDQVDGPGWLGKPVVANLGPRGGGYAQLALAPVSAVHELPDDMSFDDAVAMVGTGATALAILETAAPAGGRGHVCAEVLGDLDG
jgi:NADPH2:quinone reductase